VGASSAEHRRRRHRRRRHPGRDRVRQRARPARGAAARLRPSGPARRVPPRGHGLPERDDAELNPIPGGPPRADCEGVTGDCRWRASRRSGSEATRSAEIAPQGHSARLSCFHGTLLVIEDEEVLAKNVRRALQKVDHIVHLAATAAEASASSRRLSPDLTCSILRLPDGSGLDVLERLRSQEARRERADDDRARDRRGRPSRRSSSGRATTSRSHSTWTTSATPSRAALEESHSSRRWSITGAANRAARASMPSSATIPGSASCAPACSGCATTGGSERPDVLITGETGTGKGPRLAGAPLQRRSRGATLHRGELRCDPREPRRVGALSATSAALSRTLAPRGPASSRRPTRGPSSWDEIGWYRWRSRPRS
jgi:hypothetical protein